MSARRTLRLVDSSLAHQSVRGEAGIALLIVISALILVLGLASALILTAMVETRIAAVFKDDGLALSAADAAAGRAFLDLRTADVATVLAGTPSSFVDGPPGDRSAPDGTIMNLDRETFDLRCGKPTGCTAADITMRTEERPWGDHNPRWQLYGYGPAAALFPGDPAPPSIYLVMWVADDPADDDDPASDAAEGEPGAGVLMVAARAYGERGIRRTVEYTVERVGSDLRILTRHEARP